MDYLYGDSSPSPLASNFLEFLRDALDVAVVMLQKDHATRARQARIASLEVEANQELERLDAFLASVGHAIDAGEKKVRAEVEKGGVTACAAKVTTLVASARDATTAEVQQRLAKALAALAVEETAARAAVRTALATLLVRHDPHEATRVVTIALGSDGTHRASLAAMAPFGLSWKLDLAFPTDSAWHGAVRVESLSPDLEIRAPQLTGWLSKEVKTRPQKLDRHVITELVDDGTKVKVKLRSELGAEVGFDADIDVGAKTATMRRVGVAGEAGNGAFAVHVEDVPLLVALGVKLRKVATDMKRGAVTEAKVDGVDFEALSAFGGVVDRLVAAMAPVVREISARSLTPNELILRRSLGNDRREEIFVSKASLREKLATLPAALAAVFLPLGLDPVSDAKPDAKPEAAKAAVAALAPDAALPSARPPSPSRPRVLTVRPPLSSGVPPPASPPVGAPDGASPRARKSGA